MEKRPVILCIMDGWGHREESSHNAVKLASTPAVDRLDRAAPKSLLLASGPAVGLPEGQVGNSEVGHMTIGAGRVIPQDLARIDAAVGDGSIKTLAGLDAFAARLKEGGGTAHVMGLVSPGGVHSRDAHIMALAEGLVERGVPVALHAFTDGRDTLPRLAAETLPEFEAGLPDGARVATVVGRYHAMDRDNRWDRTEAAWRAVTHAETEHRAPDAGAAVGAGHAAGLGDEFIEPTAVGDYAGMRDGDGVLMANFRSDRVRQLMAACCLDSCGFDISTRPELVRPLGLVPYSDRLDPRMDALFGAPGIPNTLGDVVAAAGLRQLRLAETEKYPHVTFFLNGGVEEAGDGEERFLADSPDVATYDLKPEMSADRVLEALVAGIGGGGHDLIVVNFANPDMVGHTGVLEAAVKAVETVDAAVGRAVEAVEASGGAMLVTADHGNCEIMWDEEAGSPHTAHSCNPVPAYLVGVDGVSLSDGGLADIAPTLLDLLGIEPPADMTGRSLLEPAPGQ